MKAYIYVTKNKKSFRVGEHLVFYHDDLYRLPNGEIKYGCAVELMAYENYDESNFLNGKIGARFDLNEVQKYEQSLFDNLNGNACVPTNWGMTWEELFDYTKFKDFYAWHIDNLEIIEPLEISAFAKLRKSLEQENKYYYHKAPQSFCYAYYKGEKCIILSVRPEWAVKILNGLKTVEVRKTKPRLEE